MQEMLEMIKTLLAEYIRPELLLLIPAMYFVGVGLKKSEYVPDKRIPLVLGAVSVVLAFLWVSATSTITDAQGWALAAFTAITQGILCAGCSVYVNQIIVQKNKAE